MEADNDEKRDLLTKAAVTMEESMNLVKKTLKVLPEAPHLYHSVGWAQDRFGGVLNQLYLVTGKKTYLERALEICEDAVEAWGKGGRQSRVAEAQWQRAKFYDQLGEHRKAAQAFTAAAKAYTQAAEKLPQLSTFYTEYAVYMQAWSEIENARHHHAQKQYGQAKDHYKGSGPPRTDGAMALSQLQL
jgi:tetratricopeptide (TPR) repeat protein